MKEPLRRPASLSEFEFRSSLPLLGSLLARLRRMWHGVAGKWALRWLAQQQDQINRAAMDALERQSEALRDHEESLSRQSQILANHQAYAERLGAISEGALARIAAIEDRLSPLDAFVVEAEARQGALARVLSEQAATAGQLADQHVTLTREMRDQIEAMSNRVKQLESATQAYLEELGHELADLAVRVGALDSARSDGV